MISDIYFATIDNSLVTNRDISKMAFVVHGKCIDSDDLDNIREYAKSCNGIKKEVNPSIRVCLKNGEKIMAIKIYRDRHPCIGLVEVKHIIDDMEEKRKRF